MNPNGQGFEELPKDECLRLLASVRLGRIIYTLQALPAVAVVNFAMHDGGVVFRINGGSRLGAAIRHVVVAFEADEFDQDTHGGWSVTIVGTADEVTDAGQVAALSALSLDPWAFGGGEHFIRISPDIVNGRRVQPAAARPR